MEWKHEKSGKKSQSKLMSYLVRYNLLLYMSMSPGLNLVLVQNF